MTEKNLLESSLVNAILQTVNGYDTKILEKAPNLNPEDCSALVYSVIGYHLGKCKYFGLTFPLEDETHTNELRALSNGYFEIRDHLVRMGVLELENLERILRASYIKPGSVHFCEDTWGIDAPAHLDLAQLKKELGLARARIKEKSERRKKEFEKSAKQRREKDLKKREKELREIEKEIQPSEDESYDKQLESMRDSNPTDPIWEERDRQLNVLKDRDGSRRSYSQS